MTPNAQTTSRLLYISALLLASQVIRCAGKSDIVEGRSQSSGGTKSTAAVATGSGGSKNPFPFRGGSGGTGVGGMFPAAGKTGGASPQIDSAIGKAGLQIYLKLDEATTSGAPVDSSNHVAAVYGIVMPTVSPDAAPVVFANPASLSFDGKASVNIPASDNLRWRSDESFTMSLWAYPKALPPLPNFAPLLSNNSVETSSFCGIYIHDSGRWSFESNGSYRPNPEVLSASPVVLNKWQHVVIVQDARVAGQRIYVDGVAGSSVITRSSSVCINAGPFTLGANDGDGYIGLIDDVRIYGQALTEAQVKELASGSESFTP